MFERHLVRWWQLASRSLGPASSPRAIFDAAVVPLLELLGHDCPAAAPVADGLIASLPPGSVLVTIPWSEPTSHAWRRAVGSGLASQARWAIICNGRSLRIVDCARSWTRAAIEFDFDTLMTGPKGIAALWAVARAAALQGAASPTLRDLLVESDAHASHVCRSLGDGVLSALPALTMALARKPQRAADRSVAFEQALDDRVSHPVPAFRGGAIAGADLERDLPRRLYDRGADGPPSPRLRSGELRRGRLGNGPVERLPGDLAPRACRLQGRRPRSHRVQRPVVLAAPYAPHRAARRCRSDHA